MPFHSWSAPGRKPGTSTKVSDRDAERVAGADEPGRLLRGVDVQAAGEVHRLVGDHADRASRPTRPKPQTMLRREHRVHLEEVAVVQHARDDRVHVVGLVRRVRDQRVEGLVLAGDLVRRGRVVRLDDRRVLRGCWTAGRTAGRGRSRCSPPRPWPGSGRRRTGRRARAPPPSSSKVTSSPVTVLITSGPVMNMCDVPSTMSGEVGDRRRVDRAARARPHDQRDLRDHARGHHVAVEDLARTGRARRRPPGSARRRRR